MDKRIEFFVGSSYISLQKYGSDDEKDFGIEIGDVDDREHSSMILIDLDDMPEFIETIQNLLGKV